MAASKHLLAVAKAARLVNVRRAELQRRIKSGELTTFEGMIDIADLAQAYPAVSLDYNPEVERVRQIQDKAFGKRLLERILPEPEVLMARVSQLSKELLQAHDQIGSYRNFLAQLKALLAEPAVADTSDEVLRARVYRWLRAHDDVLLNAPAASGALVQQSRALQIMAPHIRIMPSEHEYFVEGNDSILEAGLREGLAIDYGCSNGNCGKCKARVISGQAQQCRHFDYRLSEWEKAEGYILMCAHTPVTDMVLEAHEAGSAAELPRQDIVTKVKAVDALSENIALLHLQTPRTNRLRFFAGQSVQLHYGAKATVTLPVASCPCDDRNLQFHVSRLGVEDFYRFLQVGNVKGGNLRVTGPEGEFVLDDDSARPLLFLAMDCGFAPIKSLIEHAMAVDNAPHMSLFRFSERNDFYLDNLCRSWTDALDDIDYHAVTEPASQWLAGLSALLPNLEQMDIYIAGPDSFVAAVSTALAQNSHVSAFVCGAAESPGAE